MNTRSNGSRITFPFLAVNLHLASFGDVYPFPAGYILCQRLQIAFNRLADQVFGQAFAHGPADNPP